MINKKVLSEIAIYNGKVKMPKGFEIEKDELVKNITLSNYYENINYPFSIAWDKLKTYITDFILIEHKLNLVSKLSYGNFYEKNEISNPKIDINPMDLNNSPDFVLLYGVEIDPGTCKIIINYDDNKIKGKFFEFNLENDDFIIFPSSQFYYIKNNKNSYLNFVQTILFDLIR
jgi:hypothetical protein